MPDPTRVALAVAVNRSGSMESIRSDAEGRVNALVAEQRSLPESRRLLLAQFEATSSAGCSAGGADDGDGRPTGEALSLDQARETYSDLADDFLAALDPFCDEYNRASPSLPATQDAAERVARASKGFAADLSAVAWPEEVDPAAVSAVVDDYEVYATQWDDVAGAASLGEVEDLLCELDGDLASAEQNLNRLREELDLRAVKWGDGDSSFGFVSGDFVTP